MRGWFVAVQALWFAACIQSGVVPCGDGVICPAGNTCENGRCVDEAQRDACAALENRDACNVHGLPGTCKNGLCEVSYCGDGERTPGEECDGADLGGEDCSTLHYYGQTTGLSCNADCTFDETGCVGACGDGIKNGNELCDGDDLGTPAATCIDAGYYDAPGLACSPFCTYDVTMCRGTCGDGVPNGGELCDGAAPPETCVDIGFDVGRLDCTTACGYGVTGCGRIGWHFLASTVATSFGYRVHASSRSDVWGVSNGGRAIHFDGMDWTQMTIGAGVADLESIWTAGPTNAWATDASGVLWHWNGSAWATESGTNHPAGVNAVWGTSASDVWVVTASAGVHRWNGTTWAPVGSVGEAGLDVIHGSSGSDVWISNGAVVRHWNGTAWSAAAAVGASANVTSLLALSPTDAWAAGDDGGKAIRSHWNGTTWTMSPKFGTLTYDSVTGSASNDVWLSGNNGAGISIVEHWDGHSWLPVESLPSVRLFELDPGTIYGGTPSTINELSGLVYAATDAGNSIFALIDVLSSTRDDYIFIRAGVNGGGAGWFDGTNWLTTPLPDGSGLSAGWGLVGNDTWIVSAFGTPYHFNGAGTFTAGTFNPSESNPPTQVSTMWGSGSNDIWYAGVTGSGPLQAAIRHYNGTDWSPRNITPALAAGVRVLKISGSGPNDVWVLTTDKRLFHWTGTWSEATNLPLPLEDMVAAGPNNVILTGGHTAHHGNEAGWIEDTLPSTATTPTHLVALGPDWVFGASSTEVFHYDGVRWSQLDAPVLPGNAPIVGLGLAPNRLDIGYAPGNATSVRGLVITKPWRCRTSESGYCADGMDNDCDGLIDTRDPQCP